MKRSLIIIGLVLSPVLLHAQELLSESELSKYVMQKSQEITQNWRQGKIQEAVTVLETLYAIPNIRELDWAWRSTLYNLACGYSLLGKKEKALSFLADAVQAGYSDYEQILKDSDLDPLRSEGRFDAILKPLKMSHYRWDSPSFASKYQDDLAENEKIAGLSKVWSETKYGFVYFDRVPGLDWDSLYVAYLIEVRKTRNTLEYYRLLQKMCAQLHDGHTGINVPNELFLQLYSRPPIQTRLIEDRVLIVSVLSDSLKKSGIHPGLEILRVDGIPVREYGTANVVPYINPSTTQAELTEAFEFYLLCGAHGKAVELELADQTGKTFKRVLHLTYTRIQSYAKLLEFRFLEDSIGYVALNSFGDQAIVAGFDSLFSSIEKSRALILDLRENTGGNSDNGYRILGYLTDRPFKIIQGKTRSYESFARAMRQTQIWVDRPSVTLPANGSKFYPKPVLLLISSRTASAAEDFCSTFNHMKRGKTVGETTAGSTGQPLFYTLPGGGTGFLCTSRALSPDGEEFVGLGIQPDIAVKPSIADIRAGRDVVLQSALKELKTRSKR
jgi:C-terminal processing protease CtpA/Prc